MRIGVGHPGSKELVHGYVLHDFAKADQAWLEPLLDAIAEAAGRLAAGDDARFLTDVARALQRAGKRTEPQAAERPAASPSTGRNAQRAGCERRRRPSSRRRTAPGQARPAGWPTNLEALAGDAAARQNET